MKNNILTIIKKEFVRFFGDKRLVFTTILLPGIMIYALYTFMGKGLMTQFETSDDYVYQIAVENMPESMKNVLTLDGKAEIDDITADEESDTKQEIEEQSKDLFIVFPEKFDEKVAAYDSASGEAAPQIAMYYNSTRTESYTSYQMMTELFDSYESTLANKFDINSGDADYDMASDKDETGKFFSMMFPMLMMMFLYSGCVAIAPESIAGEKERGTIATLLVTPIRRSQLAVGKIVSLSVIGLLSGLSSFIGTILSLPSLMGGTGDTMNAGVYQASDYVLLLLVILSTVLVMVAAMSLLSAFSKSVKEAGTSIMPLMVIIMVVSITSMFGNGAPAEPYWYLIPFYNSVQCMNGVFSFAVVPLHIIVTVISNVVYTILLAGGLAKVFDSEKIMYL